ncbi:MAG: hypothetical protein HY069_04105 [Chlamydiia bacterium]|nr:hypothetical protein [Chlamydiia bacterium]
MKKSNATQSYGIMGKVLCGCAGAIVGFVLGGLGIAILGILPGILLGHLLEKTVVGIV